jgi:hypothetical protein
VIVEQIHHVPPQQSAVGRARYLIIGAVAMLAAGVGIVLGGVLVGGSGAALSGAAGYAPADAVMYAEVRLDLPGAQRANLRALLDRFPGADADAVLTDALAVTLDEALAEGDAPFDYSHDVAPWFDGTLAMVLLDYPLNMDPENLRLPSVVGLFGVRDAAAAGALTDTLRAELETQGSSFSSSEHDGVTVWSLEVDDLSAFAMPMEGVGFAYAVTDDQLLLGNGTDSVANALDARSGDSLADSGEVGRLLADLPEERAALLVSNSAAMLAQLRGELEAAQPGLADALAGYLDAVPPISVGSLSFAEDALLFDGAAGLPEGPLRPENAERALAERVPAGAILFADGSGIGPALEQMITTMKAAVALGPDGATALDELENVESALGAELEAYVSWIGDGAMAAGTGDEGPWFGLVLEATDTDAAARRLNQIGALAELAAGQDGTGVEISTDTVDGVEVTTVTFASGMPGTDVDSVSLQYALDGETALIGMAGFVETALTLDAEDSLAASERFGAALARFGGDDNAGNFFLDLVALREAAEAALPITDVDDAYPALRENLLPLDYLAGVTRVEGDRAVSRMGLVLR